MESRDKRPLCQSKLLHIEYLSLSILSLILSLSLSLLPPSPLSLSPPPLSLSSLQSDLPDISCFSLLMPPWWFCSRNFINSIITILLILIILFPTRFSIAMTHPSSSLWATTLCGRVLRSGQLSQLWRLGMRTGDRPTPMLSWQQSMTLVRKHTHGLWCMPVETSDRHWRKWDFTNTLVACSFCTIKST